MEKYFSIIDRTKEESIGIAIFEDINQLYQSCVLNIINPAEENYSNGIIKEAIQLSLDFAFNCMNMHSVTLWISEREMLKIQCYKQAGFREMGRRRQSHIANGRFFDKIYLDILANEYSSIFINKHLDEMNGYSVKGIQWKGLKERMNYKNWFFDLGDTLINTANIPESFCKAAIKGIDKHTGKEIGIRFSNSIASFCMAEQEIQTDWKILFAEIFKELNLDTSEEFVRDSGRRLLSAYTMECSLKSRPLEILNLLKSKGEKNNTRIQCNRPSRDI